MGALAGSLRPEAKQLFSPRLLRRPALGHARYLQAAKAAGVSWWWPVNSDRSVRQIKGDLRPLTPQEWRAEVLCALACVDYVAIFDEADQGRSSRILPPSWSRGLTGLKMPFIGRIRSRPAAAGSFESLYPRSLPPRSDRGNHRRYCASPIPPDPNNCPLALVVIKKILTKF